MSAVIKHSSSKALAVIIRGTITGEMGWQLAHCLQIFVLLAVYFAAASMGHPPVAAVFETLLCGVLAADLILTWQCNSSPQFTPMSALPCPALLLLSSAPCSCRMGRR
jgi:hypothetical protein